MLFSEPKIPQLSAQRITPRMFGVRFSALQRAENSSIYEELMRVVSRSGFSALQRAENSSIEELRRRFTGRTTFQCSSASRKFLNHRIEIKEKRVL